MKNSLVLIGLLGFIGSCFALECYVCLGQRTNKDKCIKTTIQCEQEQDACKTQIRWQQPRFWQRVSERYHNISKSCETKASCDAEAAAKGFKCMRDWYRDWDCVECCQGDRCNYYATLGGSQTQLSFLLLTIILISQALHHYLR